MVPAGWGTGRYDTSDPDVLHAGNWQGTGPSYLTRGGEDWHVFLETADFDTAWASTPRPGIVVTEREIRSESHYSTSGGLETIRSIGASEIGFWSGPRTKRNPTDASVAYAAADSVPFGGKRHDAPSPAAGQLIAQSTR
jgi:hypothetical protein